MNNSTQNNQLFRKSEQVSESQPIEQEIETARHLYTVLGIMWDDAQRHLDKAQELSYSKKEKLAEEEYQKAYKIHDEATEYAESWKQEAILNERNRVEKEKQKPFISCWTEVIYQRYSRPLVGGGTFRGKRPVAAVNHCSDGTKQYFGSDHEEITEEQFNTIKKALSNPTTLDTVKEEDV